MVYCCDVDPRFHSFSFVVAYTLIQQWTEDIEKESRTSVLYRMMCNARRSICQYTDMVLNEHFVEGSEEWMDWCNDVLLFYIIRKRIFRLPIPMKAYFHPPFVSMFIPPPFTTGLPRMLF
jgi:hypothetical protein